jgi:hypothetical protein
VLSKRTSRRYANSEPPANKLSGSKWRSDLPSPRGVVRLLVRSASSFVSILIG